MPERKKPIKLYMVLPCYNEEEVLQSSAETVLRLFDDLIKKAEIKKGSRILFVDDGSKDGTWEIISRLHERTAGSVGSDFPKTKDIRSRSMRE